MRSLALQRRRVRLSLELVVEGVGVDAVAGGERALSSETGQIAGAAAGDDGQGGGRGFCFEGTAVLEDEAAGATADAADDALGPDVDATAVVAIHQQVLQRSLAFDRPLVGVGDEGAGEFGGVFDLADRSLVPTLAFEGAGAVRGHSRPFRSRVMIPEVPVIFCQDLWNTLRHAREPVALDLAAAPDPGPDDGPGAGG